MQSEAKPLEEARCVLRKFPLSNLKNFQYLHSVQLLVVNLQEQLSRKTKDYEKELSDLKNDIDRLSLRGAPEITNQKDSSEKRYNPLTSNAAGDGSDRHLTEDTPSLNENSDTFSVEHNLTARNANCDKVSREIQKLYPLERFVQHLHERMKSLECGRDGKTIWRISGFDTIYQNGKNEHVGVKSDSHGQPSDFCSPLIYTSRQGYLIYLRLYPFGCDSAAGNFVSICLAFCAGEYDAILKWPFASTIELSVLNQQNLSGKWTQSIVPCDKNIICFRRPSSKQGNMAVGLLHFMPHRLENSEFLCEKTLA